MSSEPKLGDLPAVQRRRHSTDKHKWKKLIEIEQHLLLSSRRTTSANSPPSNDWKPEAQIANKEDKNIPRAADVATVLPQPCSSAPALLGEQRILLHTSEVLETLNILLQSSASSNSHGSERSHQRCGSREDLKALHERTRTLMNERCLTVLRRECIRQVHIGRRMHNEIRSIALSAQMRELLLENESPIQDICDTCYRQRVAVLEKLRLLFHAWPALLRCVRHTLVTQTLGSAEAPCCWHGSLDAELRMARDSLMRLSREAARWAGRVLRSDLLLLCHVDMADVQSNWVAGLCASFHALDKLITDHRILQRSPPLMTSVLRNLAVGQADLAAEKLSALVSAEAKRTEDGRVGAVLGALVQCGQSLLLQYLFTASCSVPTDISPGRGRAQWCRVAPQPLGTPPPPGMEKLFWGPFWNHLSASVVRRVTQLPRQSATTEMLALCPPQFAWRLIQKFHLTQSPPDLPPQAVKACKQIHQSLQTRVSLAMWRNSWNSVLAGSRRNSDVWVREVSKSIESLASHGYLVKLHLALVVTHVLSMLEARKRSAFHPWDPKLALEASADMQCIWMAVQNVHNICPQKGENKCDSRANALYAAALKTFESCKASTPQEFYSCCYSASLEALQSVQMRRFGLGHQLDERRLSNLLEPAFHNVLNPALDASRTLPQPAATTYARLTVEAFAHALLQRIHASPRSGVPPEWGMESLLDHVATLDLPPETELALANSVNTACLQMLSTSQHSSRILGMSNRVAPMYAADSASTNSSPRRPKQQARRWLCCTI